MPQPRRIENFQRKYFPRIKNNYNLFQVESTCIIWTTSAINLFLWQTTLLAESLRSRKDRSDSASRVMTDILQTVKAILFATSPVYFVSFLQQRHFYTLLPLPWGKSLFASRFWGFRWPAAIRILSSRGENPGNDVTVNLVGMLSGGIGRMRPASEIQHGVAPWLTIPWEK